MDEMPPAGAAAGLAEIAELRRRLDDLTRLVSDWVWEIDPALRFTFVSHRAFHLLESAPQALAGRKLAEVLSISEESDLPLRLDRRLPFRDVPCEHQAPDGRRRSFRISGVPVFSDRTGAFLGYRGTAAEVTRQRQAEEALARRDAVMQAVGRAGAVLLATADWEAALPEIVASLGNAVVADSAILLPGAANGEERSDAGPLLRWSASAGIHGAIAAADWETAVQSAVSGGRGLRLAAGEAVIVADCRTEPAAGPSAATAGPASTLVVPVRADGRLWGSMAFRRCAPLRDWADAEIEALKTAAGLLGGAIHRCWIEHDLVISRERLDHQAHYDPLTDLPNRRLFFDRLKRALAGSRPEAHSIALLAIDLDRFSRINDALGPQAGDEILRQVGQRLCRWAEGSDQVARLASDEFALMIRRAGDRARLAAIVPKILASLTEPFCIGDAEVFVHASIGSALYPQDAEDPVDLLKCADIALLRAKELGGNTHQGFAAGADAKAQRCIALDQHLHHALHRGQLALAYQPVVEVHGRRIVGAEALLRWHHPDFGPVSPEDFILVAEECGLIEPIGHWVLHEACRQAAAWRGRGFPRFRIAVNVSGRQLSRGRLLSSVFSALSEADLPPSGLCIEITESAILEDRAEILETLAKLRAMGVALALDDFGTGYASFSCLRRLPLSSLKIDRSFVQGITTEAADSAIVDAILTMAKGMGLGVVAEGVADAEQAQRLIVKGCHLMQGYHFSPPLPAERFSELLHDDGIYQRPTVRPAVAAEV
jgi:diguanylate cyclase (GGDEF)-like protein